MATLTSEFIARYSTQRVKELTNPDAQGETSYNATRLAKAATDAELEFETVVGVDLDTDNGNHVRVACMVMETVLLEWGAGRTSEAKDARTRSDAALASIAKVLGRNRILPKSSSTLTPSSDGSGIVRPAFDPRRLESIQLNPPGPRNEVFDDET